MSSSRVKVLFAVGQYIVCPSNGLGIVEGTENRIVPGILDVQQFYKFRFKKDNLTFLVPMGSVIKSGIRKVCNKENANKVFTILSSPPKSTRGMWSKKAQEYQDKVFSGMISFAAEVLRDLWPRSKDPSRSYSEAVICDNAMYRVVSELAVVLNISEAIATEKVLAALAKSCPPVARVEIKHKDDFEDDLEEFSNQSDDDGDDGN